ncbi:MAG: hypothetical protein AAF993_00495 [Pseudomonadota bacterium]
MLKKVAVGGALVAMTSGAYAAVDGTLGATSTGSFDISLTVNGAVKISNLSDMTLPPFSGSDVSNTQTACVYSNSTGGNYNVTATATGASFDLNGTGGSILYNVEYDDGSAGGFVGLTHGNAAAMTNASATDDDCGGSGSNATVRVSVDAADAAAVPQGSYTSTLTLLVAPI